jgi:hypothetical protein
MSSWGLILSLSGFRYDGVDKTLYLTPQKIDGNKKMKCFFSTNTAWGVFEYDGKHLKITPIEGKMIVNRIITARGIVEVPAAKAGVSVAEPLDIVLSGR